MQHGKVNFLTPPRTIRHWNASTVYYFVFTNITQRLGGKHIPYNIIYNTKNVIRVLSILLENIEIPIIIWDARNICHLTELYSSCSIIIPIPYSIEHVYIL